MELTTYLVDNVNRKTWMQRKLENSITAQKVLLAIVIFGTCMVIGDGILTPSISGKQSIFQLTRQGFTVETKSIFQWLALHLTVKGRDLGFEE